MSTLNSQPDFTDIVIHVGKKNSKSLIKADVLQLTETNEACGSMFRLEITLFVCFVK